MGHVSGDMIKFFRDRVQCDILHGVPLKWCRDISTTREKYEMFEKRK
jgi:hypothetical protein